MGVENLQSIITEQQNRKTLQIDRQSTEEILSIINEEDQTVPHHIKKEIGSISTVVDQVVAAFENGGRLFYIGAGTSGRIGILDASECPPTYGTPPEMVQAIIAGGEEAIFRAVEGAEDNEQLGASDIDKYKITKKDVVIGITASGRAPYVLGALKKAKEIGATTVSFTCAKNAILNEVADYKINIEVGPEVITGSTRMKAGTTQKLVLNMITTSSMIKIGKVYKNLMVDVQPLNKKLVDRAKRIIQNVTGCTMEEASKLFEQSNGNPKLAIIMYSCDVDVQTAINLLNSSQGFVYKAIKAYNNKIN
ncbi:N-acetylmuramic acid 6-phosphate etherase [Sutcliffiella cohnii]